VTDHDTEELFLSAKMFATAAHEAIKHRRKYTLRPYIEHPIAVAMILRKWGCSWLEQAAACLHDVLEDTGVSADTLRLFFPEVLVVMVEGLSDVSTPEDGGREIRKQIDREHTWAQDAKTQNVKLADCYHNSIDIVKYDRNFARVFIHEILKLIEGMKHADPDLKQMVVDHLLAQREKMRNDREIEGLEKALQK